MAFPEKFEMSESKSLKSITCHTCCLSVITILSLAALLVSLGTAYVVYTNQLGQSSSLYQEIDRINETILEFDFRLAMVESKEECECLVGPPGKDVRGLNELTKSEFSLKRKKPLILMEFFEN